MGRPWRQEPHRKLRKKPMELRLTARSEVIARLLLMGMTASEIARQLKVKRDRIRYHVSTPEFQALALALHKEHLDALDKKINRMLFLAVKALEKNLKSKDWRCRASAIEQVLKMHGRFLERISITGSLDHQHQHKHAHAVGIVSEEAMSDRQRDLTRELLQSFRQPRALPPGLHDPGQVLDVAPAPGTSTKLVPQPLPSQEPPAPTPPVLGHRARL
jgi:hypothetical protein